MSRRQARLYGDLSLLATTLEALSVGEEHQPARDQAVAILKEFLLPRLQDTLPLVVAIVGSTGAGKSTLLNSLAGEVVSMPGALRPTTKRARVWVRESHAADVEHLGLVSVGDHPLLATLAFVDTPDLDSDLVEHQREALSVARASDVVVFVTTAARYGDLLVWNTLIALAEMRPLAIVLNRVPSRSSGARNDLLARLKQADLGHLPLLTISEQRIDHARKRLSPQSVQRLAGFLRELNPASRGQAMDKASDRVAELISPLRAAILADEHRQQDVRAALQAAAADLAEMTANAKPGRWRIRRPGVRVDLRDRIEGRLRDALGNGGLSPMSLEILRTASPPYSTIADRLVATELALHSPSDDSAIDRLETGWQSLLDASFDLR